jgi:CBS domain-containing protein
VNRTGAGKEQNGVHWDPTGGQNGGEGVSDVTEDPIDRLGETGRADEQAIRRFREACKRVDTDPHDRQRIRDIADLADADDLIYGQANAAIDRGDHNAAIPLLRRCAAAGIGESAWLLATVLEELGRPEAILWYARAASEGDQRAESKLAEWRTRPVPASTTTGSNPRLRLLDWTEDLKEPELSVIKVTDTPNTAVPLALWDPLCDQVLLPSPLLAGLFAARLSQVNQYDFRSIADRCLAHFVTAGRTSYHLDACLAASLAGSNALAIFEARSDLRPRPAFRDAFMHGPVKRLHSAHHGETTTWVTGALYWEAPHHGLSTRSTASLLAAERVRRLLATREVTAADIMISAESISTITPDTTVHDALEHIVRSGAKALPVHDRSYVAGIIALSDIAEHIYRARGLPSIQRIETLMRPPVTVAADTPLSEVMTVAASDPAGLLVVTSEDGTPAGYLTHEALLAHAPGTKRDSNRQTAIPSRLMLADPAGLCPVMVMY